MDTREKLLRAGEAIARRDGLRRLTVRGVAAKAKVNLGSFVYHFGAREHFVDELIERLYAPMFRRLAISAEGAGDALARLTAVLRQLLAWLVQERDFIAHLLLDAGAGEAAAQRFLQSMDKRHPALLLALITQAQAEGRLAPGDPRHQMLFLMSALALPVVMLHVGAERGVLPPALAGAFTTLTTEPEALHTRLAWALKGLAP